MVRLGRSFFNQPTLRAARRLLGCYLGRRIGKRIVCVRITETEAYVGPQDKASHASRGHTPRTQVMFSKPGHLYVYLIYGMYYCLNVVTEREGYPAAVLIRAVTVSHNSRLAFLSGRTKTPLLDLEIRGPGRVCKALKIDKRLNGEDAVTSKRLWFEFGKLKKDEKIMAGKRIGVAYAGKWQHKPWRFWIKKET